MKLTPWFPHRIKPVRNGVYQTQTSFGQRYAYWCDGEWGWTATEPQFAKPLSDRQHMALQRKIWRGVAA